jgi:hypothetical protein
LRRYVNAYIEAKRLVAATEDALRGQMTLGIADAISLALGDSGEDGENHFADAVAGHVAAQVDHVQRDGFGMAWRLLSLGNAEVGRTKLRRS